MSAISATDSQELRRPWPIASTRGGPSLPCWTGPIHPRLARSRVLQRRPLIWFRYSVQVFAIILTLSTFNCGASAPAAPAALLGLELSDRLQHSGNLDFFTDVAGELAVVGIKPIARCRSRGGARPCRTGGSHHLRENERRARRCRPERRRAQAWRSKPPICARGSPSR